MYRITNGKIVTEEAILEGYDLFVQGDRIERITLTEESASDADMQVIDAAGGYVTPGFIDIHSDYMEHMAAPRPTSLMDFQLSMREAEKEWVTHGITTMFHSLALFKTSDYGYKPIRDPNNVRQFIDLIEKSHHAKHLVRHRFHARFEVDNIEEFENVKTYILQNKVHLISFMDHTPGQGQYRDLEVYRKTVKSYRDHLGDEQIDQLIDNHQTKPKVTLAGIRELAALAIERRIAVASHDDDTIEKLELVQSFGTTISEFPITLEVARRAKEIGMHTVAGAPNVLLGGSHSGNLSAAVAIQSGDIDILCSDYYPAALLHAVFAIHKNYHMDLAQLFQLVTINPARAVHMDVELGSIREGKKADLLIIEQIEDDFPVITTVFVDGKLIQQTHYRL